MELRQVRYFVTVVDEANFTRAAAKLHVAQPGVSAQIRQLEREIGEPLLDRSGRSTTLTAAGAAFLPYARAALAAVDSAKSAVAELTGLLRGSVSVGTVSRVTALDVVDLLADYNAQYPDIETTLLEARSNVLLELLNKGELDLAFVGLGTEPPAGISVEVVDEAALVAVVSSSDELADRNAVTLDDIRVRRLICLPPGTGTRSVLDQALIGMDQLPKIAFQASDPAALIKLASRRFGVAVLPEPLARDTELLVHVLPIVDPTMSTRIDLAWRDDGPLSPAARALVRYARAAIKNKARRCDAQSVCTTPAGRDGQL